MVAWSDVRTREIHFRKFLLFSIKDHTLRMWCKRWRSWLRHCAIGRKVAGSIPDCVIEIFHWHIPSCRTIALGLTQPLTLCQEYFFGVKAVGAYGWQPYNFHVPIVFKSGCLTVPEPWHFQTCNGISLSFILRLYILSRSWTAACEVFLPLPNLRS